MVVADSDASRRDLWYQPVCESIYFYPFTVLKLCLFAEALHLALLFSSRPCMRIHATYEAGEQLSELLGFERAVVLSQVTLREDCTFGESVSFSFS
jgi:hypothetical protein